MRQKTQQKAKALLERLGSALTGWRPFAEACVLVLAVVLAQPYTPIIGPDRATTSKVRPQPAPRVAPKPLTMPKIQTQPSLRASPRLSPGAGSATSSSRLPGFEGRNCIPACGSQCQSVSCSGLNTSQCLGLRQRCRLACRSRC